MDTKQIVERLREGLHKFDDIRSDAINAALSEPEAIARSREADLVESAMTDAAALIEQQAAEIERLRAENARLRALIDETWVACIEDACSTSLPIGFADEVSDAAKKKGRGERWTEYRR